MAGLGATGFVEKSATDLVSEIGAAQRASPSLGETWVTDDAESPSGELNAIMASKLAELWQLAGLVYRSRNPRDATFAGLDAVSGLTGTVREAAQKGTVTLTLGLAAGASVPAGSVVSVAGQTTNRWVTLATVTNATAGLAAMPVNAEAETAGVYVANAGTITVIATPVTGWLTVSNASDADAGTAAETDPVLRARRESEVYSQGSAVVDAITRDLLAVSGVTLATIEENDTDVDLRYAGGLPPHSIEAIVQGGLDADVAAALWAAKAGGIRTYGTSSAATLDVNGASRTVYFTRPTLVNAYAEVTLEVNAATYDADHSDMMDAVANVTTGQLAGAPIRRSDVNIAARAVTGVIDCTRVRLGRTALGVTDLNLACAVREVLKLASARVTVVLVT